MCVLLPCLPVEFKLPGEQHIATSIVKFLINLHVMLLADTADGCLNPLFHYLSEWKMAASPLPALLI